VDFPLVLIELFARYYGGGARSENISKIVVLQGVGQYLPNFHVTNSHGQIDQ